MPNATSGNVVSSTAQVGADVILTGNIKNGEIVNADIAAGAAIDLTKVPDAAAKGANNDITSFTGLTTALSVGQGGTGVAALDDHHVLLGSGVGAVTPITPDTAGKVLVSNGVAADPSFQAIAESWQQVGQTVNAGAQTTLTVSSLPDRKHYKVFIFYHGNLGGDSILTFNADSGNNYSWRSSSNGAADVTGVNAAGVNMGTPGEWTDMQQTLWFSQVAGHEKTFFFTSTGGNPPAAAPTYVTGVGAWANAVNAINEIKITSAANLPVGSFMTVYASKD